MAENKTLRSVTYKEVTDPLSGKQIVVGMMSDLPRQYVSGMRHGHHAMSALDTLEGCFDDVTEEHGTDIYNRMMNDGEVAAATNAFVEAACSTPINLRPAITNEEDGEYAIAERIAEFCRWSVDQIPGLRESQKSQIRDGLVYGTSVSSLTFRYTDDAMYKGALTIDGLRPHPLESTSLVVDVHGNIVGVMPASSTEPSMNYGHSSLYVSGDSIIRGILPREKFAILAWNPRSGDPRGQSLLRPAFGAWWVKQKTIESMMQWAERFAWPSLIGKTPEEAQDECIIDPDTGEEISRVSATQALNDALQRFGNGSVLAVPYGTAVDLLQVGGTADTFLNIIAWANTEIVRSIQNQHLATAEGIHQARAAADVHKDVLSLMISSIKGWYCEMVRRDMLKPLVEANFPAYPHLVPSVDLGDGTGFRLTVAEVASLAAVGWFTEDQKKAVDRQLGIPQR